MWSSIMCVLSNFNTIWQSNDWESINKFMDNCELSCHKYGSCDYYSMLDDRLKELDGEEQWD